jgi:hypothetical protein
MAIWRRNYQTTESEKKRLTATVTSKIIGNYEILFKNTNSGFRHVTY